MPSINDISIALNSLFLDISHPMTLGLNKTNFFKNFPNTVFKQDNSSDFEFSVSPIFRFDNKKKLTEFLNYEKTLANRYQDYLTLDEIEEMINGINEILTAEDFFLDYSIETNDNETIILFNTNSLLFKYEVIG